MSAAPNIIIPLVLQEFWKFHGVRGMSGDHFEIFSPEEIGERNQTLETSVYCPGYLVIACDTGSRLALLKQHPDADEVFFNQASSMKPGSMRSCGLGFHDWIARGCPFGPLELTSGPSAIQEVNVVMVEQPDLKSLMCIRGELGLHVGVSHLKSLPLPATLATMSYIRAVKTLATLEINALEIQDSKTGKKLSRHVSSWRTD